MLRVLVLLLIVANAVFFAWTQGVLDGLVGSPRPEREPQRLAAQVRPELVQILPAAASATPAATASASAPVGAAAASASASAGAASAASAPGAAPPSVSSGVPGGMAAASTAALPGSGASAAGTASVRAPVVAAAASLAAVPAGSASPSPATSASAPASAAACLEAGPFTPAELVTAEAALKPMLASGAWAQRKASTGGEWMIYMGPYPDREAIDRKKAELSRIRGGVPQEELSSPPELARGLALGRFPSPSAANATLAQYRLRGIRTARVVQSSSGTPVVYLRVPQADATVATQLAALKPPGGRSFSPCPR